MANAVNGGGLSRYVGSVFWDVGGALTDSAAADWACWRDALSVERCGELYLREIRAKGHGIVLMHDIHDRTVDMMKHIMPILKREGFRFTALGEVPVIARAVENASHGGPVVAQGTCNVQEDQKLHCKNDPNVAMHAEPTFGSPVVNTLRTTSSWFSCWKPGELHPGKNTTWYFTQGDDNPNKGFVPASSLETRSDFDADPSAKGLPRCP